MGNAENVYAAIVDGKSADALRAVIEKCAADDRLAAVNTAADDRLAAVNTAVASRQRRRQKELPLAAARRLYRIEHACVLVEHGAAVEPVFGEGSTPLAALVECGEEHGAESSVRALLEAGADARAPVGIDHYDSNGRRCRGFRRGARTCTAAHLCLAPVPQHDASFEPRLRCLALLVRAGGADINALDSDGLTPLAWLGYGRWVDVPPWQEEEEEEDEDAWLESHRGDTAEAALDALLALGADPNRCGRGPRAAPPALHWIRVADRNEQPVLVRCLRKLAAAAAAVGERGALRGADAAGDSALLLAARRGLEQAVAFLLKKRRADVHLPNRVTGALPLTSCALSEPVVAALLAAGGDPNRADRRGRRPLLHALVHTDDHGEPRHDQARCALVLLRPGATTDGVRGPRGEPPLLLACSLWPPSWVSDDRLRLLEILLRRTPDADRRATLEDGRSAVDLLAGDDGRGLNQQELWTGGGMTIADLDGLPDDLDSDDPDHDALWTELADATLERTVEAHRRTVAELVVSGAPFREEIKEAVDEAVESCGLPIAARRATRATRELAARRSEARRWRAHDCLVDLALEARDAREADARLAATRARLAALERAAE
jgi:ankyrin repeat protein